MSYTNSLGVKVPVTYVCTQCHGAVTNFDIPVPDYVGYGYSQGIQTQVQILLNQLSMLLPPSGYQANPANYVADGLVKSPFERPDQLADEILEGGLQLAVRRQ